MSQISNIINGTKGLAIIALCVGLSGVSATAGVIEIPGNGMDMPKNGTGGPPGTANGNDDKSDFFRLETVVNAYNALHGALAPLPAPLLAGDNTSGSAYNSFALGGLTGYDYAVLHYGKGDGGIGGGGGVEVFYLDGASEFTFPQNGTGPNGKGGFSSIVLYDGEPTPGVPDGGTTVGLLGLALMGLSLIRRKMN